MFVKHYPVTDILSIPHLIKYLLNSTESDGCWPQNPTLTPSTRYAISSRLVYAPGAPTPSPGPSPSPSPGPSPGPSPSPSPGPSPSQSCTGAGNVPIPSKKVKWPKNSIGFYYFIDNCQQQACNFPLNMLKIPNIVVYLSFISGNSFEEDKLSMGSDGSGVPDAMMNVAKLIKSINPTVPVLYSVGGYEGSGSSLLKTFLTTTPAVDIATQIQSWKYADGIDWDIESDKGAALMTSPMAKKLVEVSTIISNGGKIVTIALMGSWYTGGTGTTQGAWGEAFVKSGVVQSYGCMTYPSNAGGAAGFAVNPGPANWTEPPEWAGVTKIQADKIAVGIAGNTNSVEEVLKIIQAYRVQSPPFKPQNIMIWSIEPDPCDGKAATSQPNDVFFSNTGKWKDVLTELQSSSAESYNSHLTKFAPQWESFESPSSWSAPIQSNRFSFDCV